MTLLTILFFILKIKYKNYYDYYKNEDLLEYILQQILLDFNDTQKTADLLT